MLVKIYVENSMGELLDMFIRYGRMEVVKIFFFSF